MSTIMNFETANVVDDIAEVLVSLDDTIESSETNAVFKGDFQAGTELILDEDPTIYLDLPVLETSETELDMFSGVFEYVDETEPNLEFFARLFVPVNTDISYEITTTEPYSSLLSGTYTPQNSSIPVPELSGFATLFVGISLVCSYFVSRIRQ